MNADDPGQGTASDADRESPLTTSGLLGDASKRLQTTPRAVFALLLAGVVVAGVDWALFSDAVPTDTYVGVLEGRFAVEFGLLVSIVSRASVPWSAYVDLRFPWLVWTVGLSLLSLVAMTLASSYALSRLLGVPLTMGAVLRYGLVLAVVRYGAIEAQFDGPLALLALPFVVLAFVVIVRLVPLPGRLVLGEDVRTALVRSWRSTDGHGWALFGVVVLVGGANHVLASVPVVGPVGSGAMAAVHAGVVAAFLHRSGTPFEGPQSR